MSLAKASLRPLKGDRGSEPEDEPAVPVQFNPATLRIRAAERRRGRSDADAAGRAAHRHQFRDADARPALRLRRRGHDRGAGQRALQDRQDRALRPAPDHRRQAGAAARALPLGDADLRRRDDVVLGGPRSVLRRRRAAARQGVGLDLGAEPGLREPLERPGTGTRCERRHAGRRGRRRRRPRAPLGRGRIERGPRGRARPAGAHRRGPRWREPRGLRGAYGARSGGLADARGGRRRRALAYGGHRDRLRDVDGVGSRRRRCPWQCGTGESGALEQALAAQAPASAGFALAGAGGVQAAVQTVAQARADAAGDAQREAFGLTPAAAPAPAGTPRAPLRETPPRTLAAPAPPPPRADERATSFGFGVPLRPRRVPISDARTALARRAPVVGAAPAHVPAGDCGCGCGGGR